MLDLASSINNTLLLSPTIHDTCHHPPCITTIPNSLPLTATIDRLQPRHTTNNGTTNSDMATPHHEPQQPPVQPQTMKNTRKRTQMMASTCKRTQATMRHPGEYPPLLIPTHLAHTQHDDGPMTWDKDDTARTRTMAAEARKTQDEEATAQERHNQDT